MALDRIELSWTAQLCHPWFDIQYFRIYSRVAIWSSLLQSDSFVVFGDKMSVSCIMFSKIVNKKTHAQSTQLGNGGIDHNSHKHRGALACTMA